MGTETTSAGASKEIVSRAEFEQRRLDSAAHMIRDKDLLDRALEAKVSAGHEYMWVHQSNWMGEPCLQLPTDMLAIADAISKSRPKYVIESGVAWGGFSLFLATLLLATGGEKVIGIDIYIPDDLRERLASHPGLSERITLVEGSSTDPATVERVRELTQGSTETMVLLDSDHTHAHVLVELQVYESFVGPGQYLICCDTAIERQPPAPQRPREWGKGNNPATALAEFLESEAGEPFALDEAIENKLLISNNWGGYIRRGV
jgi:cephalosporin hydroxylase